MQRVQSKTHRIRSGVVIYVLNLFLQKKEGNKFSRFNKKLDT